MKYYMSSTNKIHITKESLIDFCKIIYEFSDDLVYTFPELENKLNDGIISIKTIISEYKDNDKDKQEDLNKIFENMEEYENSKNKTNGENCEDKKNEETEKTNKYNELKECLVSNKSVIELYKYCLSIYPERFFDIIYQNDDMFSDENVDTHFLPGIEFSKLWVQNISDNTKQVIWKYLQITLLCVISSVKDKSRFGNTAKLFEAIDEDELKHKLEETIEGMQDMFDFSGMNFSKEMGMGMGMDGSGHGGFDASNINLDGMPSADDIHSHIGSLMSGNLGNLAREIIEETAGDLKIDFNDNDTAGNLFQKMFKNPGKLMNVIKNIEGKIENKLKDGNFNQSDLLKEAEEMMGKMKDIPGMKNIQGMLSKMGLPVDGSSSGNFNMGAFKTQMQDNLKKAKMKERMMQRLEKTKKEQEEFKNMGVVENVDTTHNQNIKPYTDEELIQEFKFTRGEAPERSNRKQKPAYDAGKSVSKTKQKSKNKKNKKH